MGETCFKGSQVDRKFSFSGLEKTLELQRRQVGEQQQRSLPKQAGSEVNTGQKATPHQLLTTNISMDRQKVLGHDLFKGMEKAIEIISKPEPNYEQMPFQLTPQAERRKKKKRSHKHRL